MAILIPTVLMGWTIGTSTVKEATALNNARHVAYTDNFDQIHAVYQTKEVEIGGIRYESYYLNWSPLLSEEIGPNNDITAYPSISELTVNYLDISPMPVVLIPYLSGNIGSYTIPNSPYPDIVIGSQLKVAAKIYPQGYGDPFWVYGSIPLEYGQTVGVPSSIGWSAWEEINAVHYIFLLTYIVYWVEDDNLLTDMVTRIVEVTLSYPWDHAAISHSVINNVYGETYAHNPSIALDAPWGITPPISVHTVWENFSNTGVIRYQVGGYDGEDWNWLDPVDLKANKSYNPFTYLWGDRLYLTWTKREFRNGIYEPGETYRDFKQRSDFNFPQQGWLAQPDNMTTNLNHYSATYDSDYPQGDACSIVCQEEVSGDSQTYYAWKDTCTYSPSQWKEWQYVADDGDLAAENIDLYPNLVSRTTISYEDEEWQLVQWDQYVWTEDSLGYYYRICGLGYGRSPGGLKTASTPLASLTSGLQDHIKINDRVPIFYEVVCGKPEPSPYCVKRDAALKTDDHNVDAGKDALIYDFPIPKSNVYYLIKAVVWSPVSTNETFDFDGITASLSTDSDQSDTLYFILQPSTYRDNDVKLHISGTKGAYLEMLCFR